MNHADHYAEAERLIGLSANETSPNVKDRLIATAGVHATLATVDRAVSRQAELNGQAKRAAEACTCAHLPDIPAAVTHVDPDCPIHGGS